jgi:hypothetical protein
MKPSLIFALATTAVIACAFTVAAIAEPATAPADSAQFDSEGRFIPPPNYRDWVFLSSGVDMSYSETATANPDRHVFDNVFAPRWAYDSFKKTGKWPDKTVLLLENRLGAGKGSINKAGAFQQGPALALEAHVKDEARFKGGWGFFNASSGKPATMIPYAADCYSCHEQHAAADTTFVQFYPTLLPVATELKTLSPAYLAETRP